MSTTQHPLTDETRDRLASYITGGTIDCTHQEGRYDALTEDDARTIVDTLWEPIVEAATPTDPHHDPRPWEPLAEGDPLSAGDEVRQERDGIATIAVVGRPEGGRDPMTAGGRIIGLRSDGTWHVRRAVHTTEKETPMTETTTPAEPLARTLLDVPEGHGAPHHDAGRIKPGDYVVQVDRDGEVRADIAHYQDKKGDWFMEDGRVITWVGYRADRPDALTVWPAPNPPAEEVEMPPKHPAHLIDVHAMEGERFAYMALNADGRWCGVDQEGFARIWPLRWIAEATLPDGTRVRRDGERPDGEPRFVKEGEK